MGKRNPYPPRLSQLHLCVVLRYRAVQRRQVQDDCHSYWLSNEDDEEDEDVLDFYPDAYYMRSIS